MDALVMDINVKMKRNLSSFFIQEKAQLNRSSSKLMVSSLIVYANMLPNYIQTTNQSLWYAIVYSVDFILNVDSGGLTENFEFEIQEDTEVFESCSAMMNGNMYIFGGHRNKQEGYKRNQVRIGLDSRSLALKLGP